MYGPGIEHGVLAIFQSRFICDTRGAGAGQLTVRVRGPKGKGLNTYTYHIFKFIIYVLFLIYHY